MTSSPAPTLVLMQEVQALRKVVHSADLAGADLADADLADADSRTHK